jgi:8-oxo-dGTP pyrophosphatase MutT (NUDIX family)
MMDIESREEALLGASERAPLGEQVAPKKISRTGVYGVAIANGKMLAIRQKRGPYAGKFDFPGGGVEFGESVESALRREFAEEVAMEFASMDLIGNLTATIDVSGTPDYEPYAFYQIGMIYRVNGCRLINDNEGEFQHFWVDAATLTEGECSKLLWKWLTLE